MRLKMRELHELPDTEMVKSGTIAWTRLCAPCMHIAQCTMHMRYKGGRAERGPQVETPVIFEN